MANLPRNPRDELSEIEKEIKNRAPQITDNEFRQSPIKKIAEIKNSVNDIRISINEAKKEATGAKSRIKEEQDAMGVAVEELCLNNHYHCQRIQFTVL